MAFSAKHFLFLSLIVLFSSTQILARESKFFSKFNHHQKASIPNNTATINDTTTTTTTTTNQGKQEEETSFTPQTTNGYGLYGHDLNQSPSTTTTEITEKYTYPSVPYKTPTEEYTGGSYESNKEVNAYNTENYGYNNKKQYGMSDTRFMDNANNVNNNNNGYETKQYGYGNMNNNNNGYETKEQDTWVAENGNKEKYYNNDRFSNTKQQGLSDTRFMENGRYFYNVNNENSYLNEYKPVSRSYDGYNYKPSQGVNSRNNYNYGNNENTEESQYQGEQNQEAFSP